MSDFEMSEMEREDLLNLLLERVKRLDSVLDEHIEDIKSLNVAISLTEEIKRIYC
jgi:hypothetical protein